MSEPTEATPLPPREVTRFDLTDLITSKLGIAISSLLRQDSKQKPIHIDTCSHGGDTNAGMVICDVLNSQNVPVTFFCGSYNYSMAALLIQPFDFLRLAYPGSRFMFHEASFNYEGTLHEINELKRWAEFGDKRIMEYTREAIGLTDKEIKKRLDGRDRYYMANEMLAMGTKGAIDGIILTRVGDHKYLCETRDGLKVIDTYIHRRGDIKNLPLWEKSK